jgi:hypothetical protein
VVLERQVSQALSVCAGATGSTYSCGTLQVFFDGEGCVERVDVSGAVLATADADNDGGEPNALSVFGACLEHTLASQRAPCSLGGHYQQISGCLSPLPAD